MSALTEKEIDGVMSEIGMRRANEIVGRPPDDDKIDDDLIAALGSASVEQLAEAVDVGIDALSLSVLLNAAIASGNGLDADELEELKAYIDDLSHDAGALFKDLLDVA